MNPTWIRTITGNMPLIRFELSFSSHSYGDYCHLVSFSIPNLLSKNTIQEPTFDRIIVVYRYFIFNSLLVCILFLGTIFFNLGDILVTRLGISC